MVSSSPLSPNSVLNRVKMFEKSSNPKEIPATSSSGSRRSRINGANIGSRRSLSPALRRWDRKVPASPVINETSVEDQNSNPTVNRNSVETDMDRSTKNDTALLKIKVEVQNRQSQASPDGTYTSSNAKQGGRENSQESLSQIQTPRTPQAPEPPSIESPSMKTSVDKPYRVKKAVFSDVRLRPVSLNGIARAPSAASDDEESPNKRDVSKQAQTAEARTARSERLRMLQQRKIRTPIKEVQEACTDNAIPISPAPEKQVQSPDENGTKSWRQIIEQKKRASRQPILQEGTRKESPPKKPSHHLSVSSWKQKLEQRRREANSSAEEPDKKTLDNNDEDIDDAAFDGPGMEECVATAVNVVEQSSIQLDQDCSDSLTCDETEGSQIHDTYKNQLKKDLSSETGSAGKAFTRTLSSRRRTVSPLLKRHWQTNKPNDQDNLENYQYKTEGKQEKSEMPSPKIPTTENKRMAPALHRIQNQRRERQSQEKNELEETQDQSNDGFNVIYQAPILNKMTSISTWQRLEKTRKDHTNNDKSTTETRKDTAKGRALSFRENKDVVDSPLSISKGTVGKWPEAMEDPDDILIDSAFSSDFEIQADFSFTDEPKEEEKPKNDTQHFEYTSNSSFHKEMHASHDSMTACSSEDKSEDKTEATSDESASLFEPDSADFDESGEETSLEHIDNVGIIENEPSSSPTSQNPFYSVKVTEDISQVQDETSIVTTDEQLSFFSSFHDNNADTEGWSEDSGSASTNDESSGTAMDTGIHSRSNSEETPIRANITSQVTEYTCIDTHSQSSNESTAPAENNQASRYLEPKKEKEDATALDRNRRAPSLSPTFSDTDSTNTLDIHFESDTEEVVNTFGFPATQDELMFHAETTDTSQLRHHNENSLTNDERSSHSYSQEGNVSTFDVEKIPSHESPHTKEQGATSLYNQNGMWNQGKTNDFPRDDIHSPSEKSVISNSPSHQHTISHPDPQQSPHHPNVSNIFSDNEPPLNLSQSFGSADVQSQATALSMTPSSMESSLRGESVFESPHTLMFPHEQNKSVSGPLDEMDLELGTSYEDVNSTVTKDQETSFETNFFPDGGDDPKSSPTQNQEETLPYQDSVELEIPKLNTSPKSQLNEAPFEVEKYDVVTSLHGEEISGRMEQLSAVQTYDDQYDDQSSVVSSTISDALSSWWQNTYADTQDAETNSLVSQALSSIRNESKVSSSISVMSRTSNESSEMQGSESVASSYTSSYASLPVPLPMSDDEEDVFSGIDFPVESEDEESLNERLNETMITSNVTNIKENNVQQHIIDNDEEEDNDTFSTFSQSDIFSNVFSSNDIVGMEDPYIASSMIEAINKNQGFGKDDTIDTRTKADNEQDESFDSFDQSEAFSNDFTSDVNFGQSDGDDFEMEPSKGEEPNFSQEETSLHDGWHGHFSSTTCTGTESFDKERYKTETVSVTSSEKTSSEKTSFEKNIKKTEELKSSLKKARLAGSWSTADSKRKNVNASKSALKTSWSTGMSSDTSLSTIDSKSSKFQTKSALKMARSNGTPSDTSLSTTGSKSNNYQALKSSLKTARSTGTASDNSYSTFGARSHKSHISKSTLPTVQSRESDNSFSALKSKSNKLSRLPNNSVEDLDKDELWNHSISNTASLTKDNSKKSEESRIDDDDDVILDDDDDDTNDQSSYQYKWGETEVKTEDDGDDSSNQSTLSGDWSKEKTSTSIQYEYDEKGENTEEVKNLSPSNLFFGSCGCGILDSFGFNICDASGDRSHSQNDEIDLCNDLLENRTHNVKLSESVGEDPTLDVYMSETGSISETMVSGAKNISLSEQEKRVWDEWERKDETATLTGDYSVTTDHNQSITGNSIARLEQLEERQRRAQHLERRARAHEKLLLHAYSALSVSQSLPNEKNDSLVVEQSNTVINKLIFNSFAGENKKLQIDELNTSPSSPIQDFVPVKLPPSKLLVQTPQSNAKNDALNDINLGTVGNSGIVKVPPTSLPGQHLILEKFCVGLRQKGIEVLKLNRDKKWQVRFLTISKETVWLNNEKENAVTNDRSQCPKGIIWVKKFSGKSKDQSILSVGKQGKGGMLLSKLAKASETPDAGSESPMTRKQKQGKFKDSVIVSLLSQGQGRTILMRCLSKHDAVFLCTGCNAVINLLKADAKAKQRAVFKSGMAQNRIAAKEMGLRIEPRKDDRSSFMSVHSSTSSESNFNTPTKMNMDLSTRPEEDLSNGLWEV